MVFERYGLKNGIVTLPGFDIDLSIGESNYLRVDGLVKSIDEHTEKLCQEFRLQHKFKEGSSLYGRTLTLRHNDHVGSIIFYKDRGDAHNTFTLGRESTNALISYGMKNTLVDFFNEFGIYIKGNIDDFSKKELCDAGGLLALSLKGISDESAQQFSGIINPLLISLKYQLLPTN
ncbi:hypothetical protein CEE44_00105 [Candidatus Woesearchaeota archaeon B3_Woes]|nr:MAG: hypothetical protein CEE44_00105 [Candidatus Woesearchaeota archaeon B3_Woes]